MSDVPLPVELVSQEEGTNLKKDAIELQDILADLRQSVQSLDNDFTCAMQEVEVSTGERALLMGALADSLLCMDRSLGEAESLAAKLAAMPERDTNALPTLTRVAELLQTAHELYSIFEYLASRMHG